MTKRIALFASGSGSNVENIAAYFNERVDVEIVLILSNRKDAYVLERAKKLGIESYVFNRADFYESEEVCDRLIALNIDLIILAGFLWLIPGYLIHHFPKAIVNIHPALLPKYGGKGMYGNKVHEAVVANNEKESGITIHWVNDQYDDGNVIFQAKCIVNERDTAVDVAEKIHALEYEYYPKVIDDLLSRL